MAFELKQMVPLVEIGGTATGTADGEDVELTVQIRMDSGSSFRSFFLDLEETKQLIDGLTQVHDALNQKRESWRGLSDEARKAVMADRLSRWDDLLYFQ